MTGAFDNDHPLWMDYDEDAGESWYRGTCKFCGTEDLVWEETDNGWRLVSIEDGELHICEEVVNAEEEFE